MPTYEYACTSCAHEWETEQSIREDALKGCPRCHAETARRQISRGTGFILKGSGWYADLYSSSSNKSPAKSESAASSDSGSTSSPDTPSSDTKASTPSAPSTPSTPSTTTP